MTITQEELKRLLHYDPDTGAFAWKVDKGTRAKVGCAAGNVSFNDGRSLVQIRINGRTYRAHWLVWLYMTGEFPSDGEIVKHVDGDALDNRWSNLVKTTRNNTKRRNNKSGVCGVSWHAIDRKWVANIMINGKNKLLGRYDTIFEAVCARKSAEMNLK